MARATPRVARLIARRARMRCSLLKFAPQTKAIAMIIALTRVHRNTPREAVIRQAPATMPNVGNPSQRFFCLRIKRNPPKPSARSHETMRKFWKRPALTKKEVGRYADRPVIGEVR